jgi:hypothetical protein
VHPDQTNSDLGPAHVQTADADNELADPAAVNRRLQFVDDDDTPVDLSSSGSESASDAHRNDNVVSDDQSSDIDALQRNLQGFFDEADVSASDSDHDASEDLSSADCESEPDSHQSNVSVDQPVKYNDGDFDEFANSGLSDSDLVSESNSSLKACASDSDADQQMSDCDTPSLQVPLPNASDHPDSDPESESDASSEDSDPVSDADQQTSDGDNSPPVPVHILDANNKLHIPKCDEIVLLHFDGLTVACMVALDKSIIITTSQ